MQGIKPSERVNAKVKFYSLHTKLLLSWLALFTFFISIIAINNFIASNIIKKKINTSVINSVNANNTYLSFIFNKAKEISNNLATEISLNKNIAALFNNSEELRSNEYNNYMAVRDLIKKIMYISQQNEFVDSIYVYSDALGQAITSNYGVYTYDFIKDCGELVKIQDSRRVYTWLSYNYDGAISHKNFITLLSRGDIIDRTIKSKLYISVNFYHNTIYNILRNLKLTPNTMIYLIDGSNNIVASQKQEHLGTRIESLLQTEFNDFRNEEFSRVKLRKGEYYQKIYQKNTVADVGILVLIPENELLKEEKIFMLVNVIGLMLVFLILMGVSFKIISHYIDKPLKIILTSIKEVEKGNFDSQINEIRMDEFGYLYKSYNVMIQKIKTLIQELYEEKLLKQAAEIKILQKQINPHFLYNTLDSINWVAKVNNVQDISQVVVALSNHYRTIFNRGSDFIQIGEMLDSIRDYLYISKFRYGDRFTYEIEADERINDYSILNLLLQPIVENALIHGIDKNEGEGRIVIKNKFEDNYISFNVIDNGKGMSEEKLKLLQASIYRQSGNYDSGIRNVHNRIRLFYGQEYGVSITSSPGNGTNVQIKLPPQRKS